MHQSYPGPGTFAVVPVSSDAQRTVVDVSIIEEGETVHASAEFGVIPAPAEAQIGWIWSKDDGLRKA